MKKEIRSNHQNNHYKNRNHFMSISSAAAYVKKLKNERTPENKKESAH
jgi:hypothetical protein